MARKAIVTDRIADADDMCPVCGRWYYVTPGKGRKPKFCSDACKQAAYRQRKDDERQTAMIARIKAEHPDWF